MTQYGNRWFDEFQLWASAGYVVVYCQPARLDRPERGLAGRSGRR